MDIIWIGHDCRGWRCSTTMNIRDILRHCFCQVSPQIEKLQSAKENLCTCNFTSCSLQAVQFLLTSSIDDAVCNSSVLGDCGTNLIPSIWSHARSWLIILFLTLYEPGLVHKTNCIVPQGQKYNQWMLS